ncbi:MAG: DNA polymerase III subunit beta, partial [Bacillota bacterium]
MKIKINQEKLDNALNVLSKGTSSKQTIPALTGIMIETNETGIRLYATNLEVGIECQLDCDVINEGKTVVPSSLFNKYIAKIDRKKIEIEKDENNISIYSGDNEVSIKCYNPDNFTDPKEFGDESIVLQQKKLKEIMSFVDFAGIQSKQETDPMMKSMKIKNNDDFIEACATDKMRLSYFINKVSFDGEFDINLPLKTEKILKQLLDSGEVSIYFKESQVKFDLGKYNIYTRLIEGEFPNYEAIMPEDYNFEIEINQNKFKKSLERAKLLNENSEVEIIFEENNLIINEHESDIGEISEKIEYENGKG